MSNNQQSRDNARFGSGMRGRLGETGWTRTRAVLSLGMVLGLGAVGTMAAWSDSATATTGMFSTSSIQMKVDNQRGTVAFAQLSKNNMQRGQKLAGAINVQNTGTIDFNWTIVAAGSGSSELVTKLKVGLYKTVANDGTSCSGELISTVLNTSPAPTPVVPRLLAAGATEPVCIQVEVLSTADQTARFRTAGLGFNFTAEGVVPTP